MRTTEKFNRAAAIITDKHLMIKQSFFKNISTFTGIAQILNKVNCNVNNFTGMKVID